MSAASEIAAVQDIAVEVLQQQEPSPAQAPEGQKPPEEVALPSLSQLLLGYLASPALTITIPLDTLLQLQGLLKERGDWFQQIDATLQKIVADGRIDSSDIPHFMELIRVSHDTLKAAKVPNKEEIISMAVQVTVHFLIDANRLALEDPDGAKKLLKALLENSLALLHAQSKGCKLFRGIC